MLISENRRFGVDKIGVFLDAKKHRGYEIGGRDDKSFDFVDV